MTLPTTALACGIDFGTSNSTVGWHQAGHEPLVPLENGETTLPSVVFFDYEEDRIHYGRAALDTYMQGDEGRLMRSLKSLLGSSLLDGQTEVQGRALPFRQLLTVFIAELKRRAEAHAGRPFEHAVLGRPVFFVDDNPRADQLAQDTLAEIARQVGLREVSFQFEPIAAAMDYESSITREERVLVVDIGGGTSDFTLIRLSPERRGLDERQSDVLATGGVHIGGTDFDRALSLSQAMPLFGYRTQLRNGAEMPSSYYFNLATWHTINQLYTRKTWMDLQDVYRDAVALPLLDRLFNLINQRAGHRLAMQVEQAKIDLCAADEALLDLTHLEPDLLARFSQAQMELSLTPLIDQIGRTAHGVLQDAGLNDDQIDTLYFTGGASAIPWLRRRIAELFPTARHVEGNRFGSIGCGLALEAARRYG
ncbi:MAG: Hsp70 family protein [Paludibacterium sp.]|uniref:Hsp70 family protein n=1 Tax=Paludibacterium sp. TaxID=1917523 RepID=UPI0025FDB055|nr:Hsp70 family protein [Paludibacterium sp.]MBV8049235.1 Hsp70 family protein [Paludibacterium sp.]MBV8646679.1 Hsp70 family protein [Paludibacterium sp.]